MCKNSEHSCVEKAGVEEKAEKHIQMLSNLRYWMLIALSIMYDCFIKKRNQSKISTAEAKKSGEKEGKF